MIGWARSLLMGNGVCDFMTPGQHISSPIQRSLAALSGGSVLRFCPQQGHESVGHQCTTAVPTQELSKRHSLFHDKFF